MKNIRILIFLASLIIFSFSKLILLKAKMIYLTLFFSSLLVIFIIIYINKFSLLKKKWYSFVFLPIFFMISLNLYTSIIANPIIIYALFFLNSFFIYLYLRTIYYYLIRVDIYKKKSLENVTSYGSFLIIFFSSSFIYGLQSILNINISLVIPLLIPLLILVIYNVILVNEIKIKEGLIFVFLNSLILLEIAWVISFLPLKFNILGLVFTLCYYILIGLTRFYLKKIIEPRIIKLYLWFGLSSMLIVLLTSQWR